MTAAHFSVALTISLMAGFIPYKAAAERSEPPVRDPHTPSYVDAAELLLKTGKIAFLDCPDESIDEIFTTQEADYRFAEFFVGLAAYCMQQVRFTQP